MILSCLIWLGVTGLEWGHGNQKHNVLQMAKIAIFSFFHSTKKRITVTIQLPPRDVVDITESFLKKYIEKNKY